MFDPKKLLGGRLIMMGGGGGGGGRGVCMYIYTLSNDCGVYHRLC